MYIEFSLPLKLVGSGASVYGYPQSEYLYRSEFSHITYIMFASDLVPKGYRASSSSSFVRKQPLLLFLQL